MKIEEKLPFKECHDCKQCILSVKEQYFYSDNEGIRRMTVRCRNQDNCPMTMEVCNGKSMQEL